MTNKIAKWRKWVELACSDCGNLMLSRDMFVNLHGMIAKNEKMQQNDYFDEYMRDTYVAHAFMMLRKHIKIHPDSVSLAGAVNDMLANIDRLPGGAAPASYKKRSLCSPRRPQKSRVSRTV